MALQNSGQISLSQIGDEMEDTSSQKGIGEYKGKGPVPNDNIAFSDFYGVAIRPDILSINVSGSTFNGKYQRGTSVTLTPTPRADAVASVSEAVQYTWTSNLGYVSGTGNSKSFTVPNLSSDQTLTVTCTASDSDGDVDLTPATINLSLAGYSPPPAPQITGTSSSTTNRIDGGGTFNISVVNPSSTSPTTGRSISYVWENVSDPSGSINPGSGSSRNISAPEFSEGVSGLYWEYKVRCRAYDGFSYSGYSNTLTFYITRAKKILEWMYFQDRSTYYRSNSNTNFADYKAFLSSRDIRAGDLIIISVSWTSPYIKFPNPFNGKKDTYFATPMSGQSLYNESFVQGTPTIISQYGYKSLTEEFTDFPNSLVNSWGSHDSGNPHKTPLTLAKDGWASHWAGFYKIATGNADKVDIPLFSNDFSIWNQKIDVLIYRPTDSTMEAENIYAKAIASFCPSTGRKGNRNDPNGGSIPIYADGTSTSTSSIVNYRTQSGQSVPIGPLFLGSWAPRSDNTLLGHYYSSSQSTSIYSFRMTMEGSSGVFSDIPTDPSTSWGDANYVAPNYRYTRYIESNTYAGRNNPYVGFGQMRIGTLSYETLSGWSRISGTRFNRNMVFEIDTYSSSIDTQEHALVGWIIGVWYDDPAY